MAVRSDSFCPVHEIYRRRVCGSECLPQRQEYHRAANALKMFWIQRKAGVRTGRSVTARRLSQRLRLVREAIENPMCSRCNQRPPERYRRICRQCRRVDDKMREYQRLVAETQN